MEPRKQLSLSQGERELLRETLLPGRSGHLLATPCSADAFLEQPPSSLVHHPAQLSALFAVGSRAGVSSLST